MINTLQSLRGVFAILVFLSHFAINAAGDRVFYNGGTIAVEYFLFLSGFVLCAAYEGRAGHNKICYKDFMTRRLVRIYPLHLACLLLWMLVRFNRDVFGWDTVLANLFLIQSWFPDVAIFYGCNTPSWYLSDLLFCYLLFPFLLRAYESRPRLFITLWGMLTVLYVGFLPRLAQDDYIEQVWLSRVIPTTRLIDFVLGMLLWQLFVKVRSSSFATRLRSLSSAARTAVEFLPVALYVTADYFSSGQSLVWLSQCVWWLPTVVCVMVFGLLDKSGGLLSRLLDSKALLAFGNASFCFYLLHMPVIGGLRRGLDYLGCDPGYVALFWLSLAVAVVASLVVSRYVDTPVTRRLRAALSDRL